MAGDWSNPLYSPHAPYPWGQCTYWALQMRPDLWNNRSSSDPDPENWAAYTWPAHASLEGLAVDHRPAARAIVAWPRTASDSTGHVTYLQSSRFDASTGTYVLRVQEFNNTTFDDPSRGQGDTMTLRMSKAAVAGVQFIHQPGWTASARAAKLTSSRRHHVARRRSKISRRQ